MKVFLALFYNNLTKNGAVLDYSGFISKLKKFNIGIVVAADLLSLTLLEPLESGESDVVIGTTQRFGIPLGYGASCRIFRHERNL